MNKTKSNFKIKTFIFRNQFNILFLTIKFKFLFKSVNKDWSKKSNKLDDKFNSCKLRRPLNVLPKKEAIELAMETIHSQQQTIHSQQKTIAELVSAVAKFSMQFPNNIVKKSEY